MLRGGRGNSAHASPTRSSAFWGLANLAKVAAAILCCVTLLFSGCSEDAASVGKERDLASAEDVGAVLQTAVSASGELSIFKATDSYALRRIALLSEIPSDLMDGDLISLLCFIGKPLSSLPAHTLTLTSETSELYDAGQAKFLGEVVNVSVWCQLQSQHVSSVELVLPEESSIVLIGDKIETVLGAEPRIDKEDTFNIEIPGTGLEIWIHYWEILDQISIRFSAVDTVPDEADKGVSESEPKDLDLCKVTSCTNTKKNKCGYCNSHHLDNCDDPYCNVDKCKKAGCDGVGSFSGGYCRIHYYEKSRQEKEDDYIGGNMGSCKVAYCGKDAYRKGYCRYHYVE